MLLCDMGLHDPSPFWDSSGTFCCPDLGHSQETRGLPRWHWGHLARPLPCPKAALGHSKESIRKSPPRTPLSGGVEGKDGKEKEGKSDWPAHPPLPQL